MELVDAYTTASLENMYLPHPLTIVSAYICTIGSGSCEACTNNEENTANGLAMIQSGHDGDAQELPAPDGDTFLQQMD